MEWPESVHVDVLGSKKHSRKGRPHKDAHNRYSAGQQEEQRRLRESFPFVPSGVILEAGSRGAASLKAERLDDDDQRKRRKRRDERPRKMWDWNFANDPKPDRQLRLHDDFAIFFPPTILFDSPPPIEPTKPLAPTRSRASSRLSQRSSRPSSPNTSHLNRNGDLASPSGGKKRKSEESDDEALKSPQRARGEGSSEADDIAAPAGQKIADSLPTSTNPDPGETQQDSISMAKAKQSKLHLEDNRNALVTIMYEAKVDPLSFGYDTHNLYFVAFAMGERGNELNISAFKTFPSTLKRPAKMPVFTPSLQPSFVCQDRILQISVSNRRRLKYPYICMAIRTESLVYFVLVTPTNTSVFPRKQRPGDPVVQVDLLSVVDAEGLEGARAVDICMHPTHFQQCLIATDSGVLYKWNMIRRRSPSEGWVHEGKLSRIMSIPHEAKVDFAPQFYRAAWGTREGTVLFTNASHTWFLDLEVPEQLILNVIDLSASTSLFTSLDTSAVIRQAEYICLTTTEVVMWIDGHDGHVAMSWEHVRPGENVQIEPIATNTVSGSAFLLRSPNNHKGLCFHVQETLQGIQSRLDPYDFPLLDLTDLHTSASQLPSRHLHLGFTSFAIPEAPIAISLLLSLERDGKITCRILDGEGAEGTTPISLDAKADSRGGLRDIADFHPRELLSRGINIDTAFQVQPAMDDDATDDMEVDDEKDDVAADALKGNGEDSSIYQSIRTRDLWKILGEGSLTDNPIVSLGSLRSLLNDPEQLSAHSVYTLHELLAISVETTQEDRQERPDSLKGYDLGLLPGNRQEQQQLGDLLEQSASALNRLNARRLDLAGTARRISGDETTALSLGDSYDRLVDSYLFSGNFTLQDESARRLRLMQDQSIAQLLRDVHLSAPTFALDRMQDSRPDNDDQITETLSRLSFGVGSGKHLPTRQKSSAGPGNPVSAAVRTALSHWELGSDPSTYVPPTLPEADEMALDNDATRPPIASAVDPSTRAVKLPRVSLTYNSAPPVRMDAPPSPSAGASLPTFKNQSQVHFEAETQSQSQDFASTQIVPGPFGSRTALSFRRSLGKKRTIGF